MFVITTEIRLKPQNLIEKCSKVYKISNTDDLNASITYPVDVSCIIN